MPLIFPLFSFGIFSSEKLVKLGYTNIIEIGGINSWPGETVTGDK